MRPIEDALFARVAGSIKVVIDLATIAEEFGCEPGPLEAAAAALAEAGLLERWDVPEDSPPPFVRPGPAVSLTPMAAGRLGRVLNAAATRWVERAPRFFKVRRRPGDRKVQLIVDTDLGADPPGRMADVRDHRADADPAWRVESAEASGLVRPAYLVGMDDPWPLAGQDRGPAAPPADPADDPRGGRLIAGACRGCGGSVGRGEYCPPCDRYYLDHRLPRRLRAKIEAMARSRRGEPPARKGATG